MLLPTNCTHGEDANGHEDEGDGSAELHTAALLDGTSDNVQTTTAVPPVCWNADTPQGPSDASVLPLGAPSHALALNTAGAAATGQPYSVQSVLAPVLLAVPYALMWTGGAVASVASSIKHLFVAPEYDKTKVTDAIDKLQSTLHFLDKKITHMNTNVDKYTAEAKRLYACNKKPAAMHQLRLKKMYEREVSKMDSLKFNIESNILHMESVDVMMETVSTIKETSQQFQIVSRHVDIGKLEDSIEEMFEQRDTSKDIENILNDMHSAHEFDEEELMEELETLVSAGQTAECAADHHGQDRQRTRSPDQCPDRVPNTAQSDDQLPVSENASATATSIDPAGSISPRSSAKQLVMSMPCAPTTAVLHSSDETNSGTETEDIALPAGR